jgi:hypothetical protein
MMLARLLTPLVFASSARCVSATVVSASADAEEARVGQVDLERERALLGEAEAARRAADLATARAKAREVVSALLARTDLELDEVARELLGRAAHTAWVVRDAETARSACARLLEVAERTRPPDHPELQAARQHLALTLKELSDLAGARALEEQVLAAESRRLPEDHADVLAARTNLAVTLHKLGDFAAARALFEQVVAVRERTMPDDHPEVQGARRNLATTIRASGDLAAARALFEEVLASRARTLPDDHPELRESRRDLAGVLYTLRDLEGARALSEEALASCSRSLPDDHPELQAARHNLAAVLEDLGELAAARALKEESLRHLVRVLPAGHSELLSARQSLAGTMARLGDLAGARELLEEVIQARARTLPADHPDLARSRGNLATILQDLGDPQGARALAEEALEALSQALPDDHPDVESARQMLGDMLRKLGRLEEARALLEQVVADRARTLPDDHPDLDSARQSLAATLSRLGERAGARELLEQVVATRARALPDDHLDLARARGNLAVSLKELGDLAGARALEEGVLGARARALPDDHPELQLARWNLARTLGLELAAAADGEALAAGETRRECAGLALALCQAQRQAARSALLEGSPREAEARCAGLSECLGLCLSLTGALGVLGPLEELDRASFELGEATRGAALTSAALMRAAADAPEVPGARAALRRAGQELADLVREGTTSAEFQGALARRDAAQRELVRLAQELPGAPRALDMDLDLLRARLAEREALLAYRRYRRWTFAGGPDATARDGVPSLCAFVVRGEVPGVQAALVRVDLGPLEPIEAAVHAWRSELGVGAEARGVVSDSPVAPGGAADERGRALRRLVFDPLRASLAGAERVVVVPDDVLHLVPLDALPTDEPAASGADGERLGDRLRIETRVTSTELLGAPGPIPDGGELVVVGGVAYGAAGPGGATLGAARPADAGRRVEDSGILRGGAWARGFAELPATALEARSIAEAFAERAESAGVTLLEGDGATRARLFEAAPRARYLHVATHGWFAPESIRSWHDPEPLDRFAGLALRPSGEEQVKGMSPMLLCGLALAGANGPEDDLGRVPGLVSAEEIAALDLARCELAVLSACDTNVGERRAGQGVASLQRALQVAGARAALTSLWKVPDEATRELMTDFYRRLWVQGEPMHVALWEAKRRLRNARDESGRPRYALRDWAAWVLTGELR